MMAIFGDSPCNELDYQMLQDGGVCLYRSRPYLEEDIDRLVQRGYLVYRLDCTTWTSEAAMHESLRSVLRFPEYYGKNLNALSDCMTDLVVPEQGGVAIVFDSYDVYTRGPGSSHASHEQTAAGAILSIMASASRVMLLTGRRLVILVQSDDPRIQFSGLGSISAQWNRREWLNKDRGL
jgi:barstar (barnase inhibitor)